MKLSSFVFVFWFTTSSYNNLTILHFLKAESELQGIKDELSLWSAELILER